MANVLRRCVCVLTSLMQWKHVQIQHTRLHNTFIAWCAQWAREFEFFQVAKEERFARREGCMVQIPHGIWGGGRGRNEVSR
jgi:hypothetical protein